MCPWNDNEQNELRGQEKVHLESLIYDRQKGTKPKRRPIKKTFLSLAISREQKEEENLAQNACATAYI